MATPDGLRCVLAGLMMVVAGYHAIRLAGSAGSRNRGRFDVELTHFAMGLAMAAMLVATLPRLANQVVAGVSLAALAWFRTDAIHSYVWHGPVARAPAQQVPSARRWRSCCRRRSWPPIRLHIRPCRACLQAATPRNCSPRRSRWPLRSRPWLH